MGVIADRERGTRPSHERRALQHKLDAQVERMREFSKDRAVADEVVADWRENAWDRLQMVTDVACPIDPGVGEELALVRQA